MSVELPKVRVGTDGKEHRKQETPYLFFTKTVCSAPSHPLIWKKAEKDIGFKNDLLFGLIKKSTLYMKQETNISEIYRNVSWHDGSNTHHTLCQSGNLFRNCKLSVPSTWRILLQLCCKALARRIDCFPVAQRTIKEEKTVTKADLSVCPRGCLSRDWKYTVYHTSE